MDSTFIQQMEENTCFSLLYPYHIKQEDLLGNHEFSPNECGYYNEKSFEKLLNIVYLEPKAFYLTEDDKKFYSNQELEFINRVIIDELKKIEKGMVIINIDMTPDTLELLEEYKAKNNMTFEEAVIDILTKFVKNNGGVLD